MEHNQSDDPKPRGRSLQLPPTVVTTTDVKRLLREAKDADEFMRQAALRKPGTKMQLPKSSVALDKLSDENNLSLLKEDDRVFLIKSLELIDDKAPVLHMSFAASPSDNFLRKIITWFRQNIHEQALLQVGLQPSIAGGCTLRTSSRYFDFSLRRFLMDQKDVLLKKIEESETKA